MKELFEDIKSENFTKLDVLKYGILYPIGFIAFCGLAECLCK